MRAEKVIDACTKIIDEIDENKLGFSKAVISNARSGKGMPEFVDAKTKLYPLFEMLYDACTELRDRELRTSKGSSYVSRCRKFNKLLQNNSKRLNGRYNKAWRYNGQQVITNTVGTVVWFLSKELDIPTVSENDESWAKNVDFIRYDDTKSVEISCPLEEIRACYKTFKASHDRGTKCVIELGNKLYNAEYVLQAAELLGGEIKVYEKPEGYGIPLSIQSENGIAVVYPIKRMEGVEPYEIW